MKRVDLEVGPRECLGSEIHLIFMVEVAKRRALIIDTIEEIVPDIAKAISAMKVMMLNLKVERYMIAGSFDIQVMGGFANHIVS